MRIITISREFGSGGRELGKRLSDVLEIPCYDKEVSLQEDQKGDPNSAKGLCIPQIR